MRPPQRSSRFTGGHTGTAIGVTAGGVAMEGTDMAITAQVCTCTSAAGIGISDIGIGIGIITTTITAGDTGTDQVHSR